MVRRLLVAAILCGSSLLQGAYADTPAAAQGSDAEITDRVIHKLADTDRDIAPRIRVSTVNGVVTLEGTVFSNNQALQAVGDARAVAGVVKVRNRLTVRM